VKDPLRLLIVTGLSGSGKSTAIKVIEDLGFYCIDNLPVALIPRFVELWESSQEEVRRVALGLDVRERHFLDAFPGIFQELRERGVALEVLYLEASDDVLVRRFSETRAASRRERRRAQDGIRRSASGSADCARSRTGSSTRARSPCTSCAPRCATWWSGRKPTR
jgi:UPF0042 nucleotide-binding protein